MALGLFSRKKKKRSKKKSPARVTRAPSNHASGSVSPRAQAPRRPAGAPPRKPGGGKRRGGGGFSRGKLIASLFKLAFIGAVIGGIALLIFITTLPDIRQLEAIKKKQGITIETEDGRIIATYGDVYGSYVPYDKLPKHLIEAVVATEDRRFFSHGGIDVWGILRAAIANARAGSVVQGGSTITQQLAKNVFLTPERSLKRKIQEVLLAFWLESRYSKKEIMAIYLNRVYLGSGTFGIDAASRRYFNKPATEMSMVESAMLAGLLKAPSRYAPTANSERAMARAHQVLMNMVDGGYLDAGKVKPALIAFAKEPKHTVEGDDVRYFGDWVVDEIPNYVGNVDEDIIVVTTMDPKIQEYAADALENTISMEGEKKKISQGAVVTMAPDGAVKALVGGVNYGESQYNRAAQAKRQPGSSFKLFVYLAALEAGYTPGAQVDDAPIAMTVGNKVWNPGNYSGQYKGLVSMSQGFRESLNTVAVRLSQYAGVGRVAQMAMRLGIPNVPARPSIALGSVEATLLEMTGAYAHMANHGNAVKPYGILQIHTAKGKELYKREEASANPVLATGTVEMMNYMLLDVVRHGTGTRAGLPGREVGGKTGTSQDYKDAWFIGFTPQLVTGVWVGNDNNRQMAGVTGGNVPAMIWHDTMIKAMEGLPAESIPNKSASGEGLLPWLFGGTTATPDEATEVPMGDPNAAPMPQPEQVPAPVDSPFGYVDQPPPQPMPPEPAARSDEGDNGDVLTPEFWGKLMDQVPMPDKGKVEYVYPGDDRRRGH